MESLERKYIQQFVSSSVATEVKNRLTKCYDRLLRAGTELGAPQSGTFYEIRSRGEIQAFLTAICSPTEVDPLVEVNSSRVTEWRALALRKLSSSLVGTRMMLVPLVFVSLETHQKYRIYESLLVKSVTAGSDVTFYDMKGRRFWRFDQFLDGGGFPFGIMCYSGSNGSLEYQIVGMKSVVTRTTDALFGTLRAALDCHFCIGIDACNYTAEVNRSLAEIDDKVVSCTAELVHLTNESLAGFMPTLRWTPVRSTEEFQCVHVRATSLADITFLFIRGCTYATNNQSFCDLRHSSFQGRRECVACDDADSCNDVPSSATRSWIAWLTTITAMLIAASTATVNR
ncbi:hypothetical protein quinque_016173 [Culex quinquefasciatus]